MGVLFGRVKPHQSLLTHTYRSKDIANARPIATYCMLLFKLSILVLGILLVSHLHMYGRASDNGPSEQRTTSLQRTSAVLPIEFSIVIVHILCEVKGLREWLDQISIMSAQSIICYLPGEILREVKVHT